MSEKYIKASDVKKMISENKSLKEYFPWAENMFLELIDDIPEADVVPLEWIKDYAWSHTGSLADVTYMLAEWRNRDGDTMESSD